MGINMGVSGVNARYSSYSMESIFEDVAIIDKITQGLGAIGTNYSRFMTYSLPILSQIEALKSSRSAKNHEAIDSARMAFVLQINNQIGYNRKSKTDYNKDRYKAMTEIHDIFFRGDFAEDNVFTYTLSFKYIKDYLDDLFMHLKEMSQNKNVSEWKKYFPEFEKDFRNINGEICGFRNIFEMAFLNEETINTIESSESAANNNALVLENFKIKNLHDIVDLGTNICLMLEHLMIIVSIAHTGLLMNVHFSDPNNILKAEDAVDNGTDVISKEVHDTINKAYEELSDEVEDFFNT